MDDITQTLAQASQTHRHGIVDCDVHPLLADGIRSLYPYMADAWRQRFVRKRAHQAGGGLTLRYAHPTGTVGRDFPTPDGGGPGGSDPHFLIKDHLDANDISVAVLNSLQTGAFCSVHASADESIVIAQAANDYYLDQWLPLDPRLFYAPVVSAQDPLAAAAEIRRIGDTPRSAPSPSRRSRSCSVTATGGRCSKRQPTWTCRSCCTSPGPRACITGRRCRPAVCPTPTSSAT